MLEYASCTNASMLDHCESREDAAVANRDNANADRSNETGRPAISSATSNPHNGPSVKPYVLHTATSNPGYPAMAPRTGRPSGV